MNARDADPEAALVALMVHEWRVNQTQAAAGIGAANPMQEATSTLASNLPVMRAVHAADSNSLHSEPVGRLAAHTGGLGSSQAVVSSFGVSTNTSRRRRSSLLSSQDEQNAWIATGDLDSDPEAALVQAMTREWNGARQTLPVLAGGEDSAAHMPAGDDRPGQLTLLQASHDYDLGHAAVLEDGQVAASAGRGAARRHGSSVMGARRHLLPHLEDTDAAWIAASDQDEDPEAAILLDMARTSRGERLQHGPVDLQPDWGDAAVPNLRQFDVDYKNFRVSPRESVLRKLLGGKPILAGLQSELGLERLRVGASADPTGPASAMETEEDEGDWNSDDSGTEILLVRSPVFVYVKKRYADAVFEALREERPSVSICTSNCCSARSSPVAKQCTVDVRAIRTFAGVQMPHCTNSCCVEGLAEA